MVTADELGPGDTFGEACMLDEHRTMTLCRRNGGNGNGITRGGDDEDDDNDDSAEVDGNFDGGDFDKETSHQEGGQPPHRSLESQLEAMVDPKAPSEPPGGVHETPGGGINGGGTGAGAGSGLDDGIGAVTGRSMETYQTLEPTRLILILKDDFYRISGLLRHCAKSFMVMGNIKRATTTSNPG